MANKTELLQILQRHVGKKNGIHVSNLAAQLQASDRAVRKFIEELREAGAPICGKPSTGYFLATSQAELEETANFLSARAKTTLDQADRLRRAILPDPHQPSLI